MRVSVDQHGRINIYHTIPEIRILSKDQVPVESQKAKMQMDPEPGKPQPELNPEARRILEKLLADETIPERQDLEGLKIPISKLVKVHRWTELFDQKIKIYRVGFCNSRYSVGDAAGAYYADKRFWRLPSAIKAAGSFRLFRSDAER